MGVWIAVAAGGALGSVARHAVNHLIHMRWLTTKFPVGTAVVNIAGCFAIGLLAGLVAGDRLPLRFYWREFLFAGVLGGFTTFSTLGLDTFMLVRTHSPGAALANVATQMFGGFAALWAGYQIGVRGG